MDAIRAALNRWVIPNFTTPSTSGGGGMHMSELVELIEAHEKKILIFGDGMLARYPQQQDIIEHETQVIQQQLVDLRTVYVRLLFANQREMITDDVRVALTTLSDTNAATQDKLLRHLAEIAIVNKSNKQKDAAITYMDKQQQQQQNPMVLSSDGMPVFNDNPSTLLTTTTTIGSDKEEEEEEAKVEEEEVKVELEKREPVFA